MYIYNNVVKTLKVIEAKGIWENIVGLIGKRKLNPMLFHTRFGIHTFGMIVPIDVIILDNTNRIMAIKKKLKPGRIFLWNPKYGIVIELPEHTIDRLKLFVGETVHIVL
jgi:uncharacterized protein